MTASSGEHGTTLHALCTRKSLSEAVQLVAHAVTEKNPLDILKHVLVQSHGDGLLVSANDLELGIAMMIPAEVRQAGALTANARVFSELVASFPEGEIELAADRSHAVEIRIPGSKYRLLGFPPEEYPSLPQVDDTIMFTIAEPVLRDACRQTLFSVLLESKGRPILSGILIDLEGDRVSFVATDTLRLALRTATITEARGSAKAIVPHRAMNDLARALGDEGFTEVRISEKQVQFTTHRGVTVTSRLIEGQYPAYRRVLPTTYRTRLTFQREALYQAVKRAFIVSRTAAERIEIHMDQDKVVLRAESATEGKAEEEVEVLREGDPIDIVFNARHVLDALSAMDSEGVMLDLTDSTKAAVLQPKIAEEGAMNGEYLCLLMPLQLY